VKTAETNETGGTVVWRRGAEDGQPLLFDRHGKIFFRRSSSKKKTTTFRDR
jgi:hypothetical protein